MFINENSNVPKYKQIVQSVIADIESGQVKKGETLLSINEFSEEHYLARDTVEKAYKELRERGIIISVRGKGYFVNSTDTHENLRIFLHFNKLSTYKKTIYDAFVKTIESKGIVDIFIHHDNIQLFENQLLSNLGNYTNYVIIPPSTNEKDTLSRLLKKIPSSKLLLLDKTIEGFDNVSSVYQNFETDISDALTSGLDLLKKYRKLSLIFPHTKGYASEVMLGFTKFCQKQGFEFDIISEIQENKINAGKAFIVIEEEDLVKLLKLIKSRKLKLGTDVGIISYNETPLKEILAEGITVISTDFEKMGESAASFVLNGKKERLKNDFRFIKRSSL
jgi:DNA-binding transcriptional regulator YhcF (GntR family)